MFLASQEHLQQEHGTFAGFPNTRKHHVVQPVIKTIWWMQAKDRLSSKYYVMATRRRKKTEWHTEKVGSGESLNKNQNKEMTPAVQH
jgi:hypothetical protein